MNQLSQDTPYVLYTVKAGDSWWRIAANEMGSGSKYKELMTFNRVDANNAMLHPGMEIKIPAKEILYTVQNGDSWWSIAAKTIGSGLKYCELAAYNDKSTSYVLHPGDVLRIPV